MLEVSLVTPVFLHSFIVPLSLGYGLDAASQVAPRQPFSFLQTYSTVCVRPSVLYFTPFMCTYRCSYFLHLALYNCIYT